MLSKEVNLVFIEGLFKLLNHSYTIDDVNDIKIQYNNGDDDFDDRRIEYLLLISKIDEVFARRLCKELVSLCKVGYRWLSSKNEVYLVIYIDDEVTERMLRGRIQKFYDFKESNYFLYSSAYKNIVSQLEGLVVDKEYVVTYRSKKTGKFCKALQYALTPDEAYKRFMKTFQDDKYVDFSSIEIHDNEFKDVVIEPEPKMVYSESLDEDVIAGFTIENEEEGTMHYSWHDEDCVYYWDDSDESYYMEVPKGAKLDY